MIPIGRQVTSGALEAVLEFSEAGLLLPRGVVLIHGDSGLFYGKFVDLFGFVVVAIHIKFGSVLTHSTGGVTVVVCSSDGHVVHSIQSFSFCQMVCCSVLFTPP